MSTRGRSKGFTLIELMVVLSVIGILAAIAIPNFSAREGKAFDARIVTDVRNAAAGQEAYFMDNLEYSSDCTALPGFKPSEGVTFTECSTDGVSFRITTTHTRSTKTCTWDSVGDPVLDCRPKG
jgi:type IV pilus assembly protein PilA